MNVAPPSPWNSHYTKDKSLLSFPDENLVRMLSKDGNGNGKTALDLGCGSGRHLPLLASFGYTAIGSDIADNALQKCKPLSDYLLCCSNTSLPLKDSSVHCTCAWGSLHYCFKHETRKQIAELFRIMKTGGILYGTLRAETDNFFERIEKRNSSWLCRTDSLKPLIVSFFDSAELTDLFSIFSSFSFGYCARTQIGEEKLIAHWYFRAEK